MVPKTVYTGAKGDVGFLSVMLSIPLVNKEATLGLLQGRIGQDGNSKQIEDRVGRVREMPCSCQRRQIPWNLTGKTTSLVVKYKIIEMD